jgi:hypothetical protein
MHGLFINIIVCQKSGKVPYMSKNILDNAFLAERIIKS